MHLSRIRHASLALICTIGDHATGLKMAVQDVPTVFLELPTPIIGPDADGPLPPEAEQPDYEAELAIVIGTAGRPIMPDDWKSHVFG